jgi:hypothetical protein
MTLDHTTWTCADTENRLTDFLDGVLAPGELAAFEQHRAGCATCTALAARVGATVGTLHSMALLEEPPELVRAILDRTIGAREVAREVIPIAAAPEPDDERRGWFDWFSVIAQPQFAYGLVAVLVSALVVSHALGIQWRRPTSADLDPANLYREANRSGHIVYARGTKIVSDSRIVYEIQSEFESEPESAPAPQPTPVHRQAPGQTRIAPSNGPYDPTRASRPANTATRAAAEMASLIVGMYPRKLS